MPVLTSYDFQETSRLIWLGDYVPTVELGWNVTPPPSSGSPSVVQAGTTYSSSDPTVATIRYSSGGTSSSVSSYASFDTRITAVGVGTADLTATYTDDNNVTWTATISVEVKEHVPVIVNEDSLEDIADAIRETYNTSSTYKPGEMAEAIRDNGVCIPRQVKTYNPGGGDPPYDYLSVSSVATAFSLPPNIEQLSKYALAFAFTEDSVSASSTSRMLQSVDLGHIKSIHEYGLYRAFSHCRHLESADLSSLTRTNGDYAMYGAFDGCTKLTSLDLSNLTSAGGEYSLSHAFANSSSSTSRLASVDLSALTEVGGHGLEWAFGYDTSLTSISFPALTKLDSNAFTKAFYGCTGLTSFSIANDLTNYRFYPSSCFSDAFHGCTSLTSVSFDNFTGENPSRGVWSSMFVKAFYGCTSLTTVSFPKMTYVASSTFSEAFTNCNSLTTLSFPAVTEIDTGGFSQAAKTGCTSLTTVSFPELTTAAYRAFEYAFDGKTTLTSATFPKLQTAADDVFNHAFRGCTSLTSMTFPALSSLTHRDTFEYAFSGCTSLTSVSFPALTTTSFSTTDHFYKMLNGCSNVTVHFPAAIQSTIGSWSDVRNGFGGTNTTVLFDL